jgi:hypothetical protein
MIKKLAKLEAALDKIANDLERAGFQDQAQVLDTAAEKLEDVRKDFASVS